MIPHNLYSFAIDARNKAHAPYSGFKVGASLITMEGEIFTGANIETDVSSCGICAERLTISQAILEHQTPTTLVLVADTDEIITPCGICRQFIMEFRPMTIWCANLRNEYLVFTANDLLPNHFHRRK